MNNYKDSVLRTEAPIDARLRDRLHVRDNIRLLHAIMGIVSEIEELDLAIHQGDKINIGEEIGDGFYYCYLMSDVLNLDLDELNELHDDTSIIFEMGVIINTSSKIVDLLKKTIFYGRTYSVEDFRTALSNIYTAFCYIAQLVGLDIEEIKKKNSEKLATRYGGVFTASKANNRDLELERKVLESVS